MQRQSTNDERWPYNSANRMPVRSPGTASPSAVDQVPRAANRRPGQGLGPGVAAAAAAAAAAAPPPSATPAVRPPVTFIPVELVGPAIRLSPVIRAAPNTRPGPVPPPERVCVACCEPQKEFIRPCICHSDFCHDCLEDRFIMAIQDSTMFPARCCTLLQLHTVLPNLSTEHAQEYRSRFEEWISRDKTYCPSPSCASFIPDRVVESANMFVPPSIRSLLNDILLNMSANPSARFFREELDITELPGDTLVLANPIYLVDMQAKLDQYACLHELTQDIQLLWSNAHAHGTDHPIAQAANELFNLYLHEISEKFKHQTNEARTSFFACPACHMVICAECKKKEHRGQACDNSEREEELAMLEKFGYKQCPRCRTAVRKMYGCPSIVCRCGAGWCWGCTRSIDVCDGQCGMDDEDDEEYPPEEEIDGGGVHIEGPSQSQNIQPPDSNPANTDLVNLDAGGYRRWQGQDLDFGEEPDNEGMQQVWSCEHSWRKYRDPKDGFCHGDSRLIECNRCFKGCPHGKGTSMCTKCRLLVCSGCKEYFKPNRTAN